MADPTDEPEPHKDAMEGAGVIGSHPPDMRCCCGKEECVFLRHNCSVLLSVERDVHVAAKMGQVCLGLSLHSYSFPNGIPSSLSFASIMPSLSLELPWETVGDRTTLGPTIQPLLNCWTSTCLFHHILPHYSTTARRYLPT